MKQKKTTEWKSVESSIIIHLIIYYLFSMSRLTIFFSFRIAYGLTIFHEIHFEKSSMSSKSQFYIWFLYQVIN